MKIEKTHIPGPLILKPDVYIDERGYFYESYNINTLAEAGINETFLQDNESLSARNVLRGLHFQNPPFEQGKLVRVVKGSVIDVAVDIRKGSPYYGKWISVELSEKRKELFWVPAGFAHGFLAREDNTIFSYKCTNIYHKESEVCIIWNDPDINIDWPVTYPVLTERDKNGIRFRDFESRFIYQD